MKGRACSWRDMRRIKHILENADRLKGEMSALANCVDKSTLSGWRRISEIVESLDIQTEALEHVAPSHAYEIARRAEKDAWPEWVERCERERWTVAELRGQLQATKNSATQEAAKANVPQGKYSTIVVDPPWSYGNKSGRHGKSGDAEHYLQSRTMTLDEVTEFDVERWVAEPCHLYLWVTDAYLGRCYQILDAWNFDPKTSIVWRKDRIGMGNYYRHQHELCIFAVRGQMRLKRMNASTVFDAPVKRHSEKPDAFYRLVESCSPGPYLDVFARKRRAGWDVFGDEIGPEYQARLDGNNESVLVG